MTLQPLCSVLFLLFLLFSTSGRSPQNVREIVTNSIGIVNQHVTDDRERTHGDCDRPIYRVSDVTDNGHDTIAILWV